MEEKKRYTYQELKEKCLKKHWRTLPLYAQWVTYRASLRLVQLIYRTAITPNQVTWFALLLAAGCAFFFSRGTYYFNILAAVLLELYYVFDCVDGQLARLKGVSSREGAFIDYLFNYIVHPGVFFSIGAGCFKATADSVYIFLGVIAAWATMLNYALSDTKHSVHLQALLKEKAKPAVVRAQADKETSFKPSFAKRIFMCMHKLATYPSIMNIISLCAVTGIILQSEKVYNYALWFFACNISVVFVFRLIKIVKTRDITAEFDSLKSELARKED